jgi:hypothetical protein
MADKSSVSSFSFITPTSLKREANASLKIDRRAKLTLSPADVKSWLPGEHTGRLRDDTKEVEGKFKGLVTDPHIYINNKNKGQFKIKSYHRFLITTNNEDPIKTSPDDRRNLIIRASDEVCGNKAYFSKLYKLLDDVNVIRTCYDYFNSIPNLENFHELDTPKTEHQTNLAKLSLTPPEQFLIDLCSKKEGIVEILSKDLYDQFMSFTIDHNIEYSTTPLKFAVKLANLKISGFEKGKHTKKGDFKNIDIDKVRKHFKLGFVDDN